MACSRPIRAWRGRRNEAGKYPLVFDSSQALNRKLCIKIPCNKCVGCQLEYSRQWAIRCVLESKMHDDSMFLTLTYNDENLPDNMSIQRPPVDVQLFLKRLRKYIQPKKIKFFQCGEYGEDRLRPHHHMLLYGWMPDDLIKLEKDYWISEIIDGLWKKGNVIVGRITFESSAYVARYALKKIGIDKEIIKLMIKMIHENYSYDDLEKVDKFYNRQKPYITMSRKKGIGRTWLEKFKTDVYPSDELVIRGNKMKPPRFYDTIMDVEDPEMIEKLKIKRRKRYANIDAPLTPAEREKNRFPRAWRNEILLEKINKKKLENYREILL